VDNVVGHGTDDHSSEETSAAPTNNKDIGANTITYVDKPRRWLADLFLRLEVDVGEIHRSQRTIEHVTLGIGQRVTECLGGRRGSHDAPPPFRRTHDGDDVQLRGTGSR
jgi:hypothetical protein